MTDFARFDRRHYETLPVRSGYACWAPTYDDTVDDAMDVELLNRIDSVRWQAIGRAADLGCGSGRTARWLRTKAKFPIDGVDMTPEMLELARRRDLHDRLIEADVRRTGLDTGAYGLVVCGLVDEHLSDLGPLYAEARRLLGPTGTFVLVGVHPFFLMSVGMPTHFDGPEGRPVAIETHLHLPGEHIAAASAAGLVAAELHEGIVGDRLIELKPSWEAYRGWPFSYAWVWSAP
jgi:SAM-dependent methyltransferase